MELLFCPLHVFLMWIIVHDSFVYPLFIAVYTDIIPEEIKLPTTQNVIK